MIRTKSNLVVFTELTPALAYIFYKLEIFHSTRMSPQPDELVITSINDSKHSENSRHYTNEAIDLRSHNFKSIEDKEFFRVRLESFLGPKFTVLLENVGDSTEHFHIQVKKGMRFP